MYVMLHYSRFCENSVFVHPHVCSWCFQLGFKGLVFVQEKEEVYEESGENPTLARRVCMEGKHAYVLLSSQYVQIKRISFSFLDQSWLL